MIAPAEILRGARVALGWPRHELASNAGVSAWTVAHIERGGPGSIRTLRKLHSVLEGAGISFVEADDRLHGPGMRLPPQLPNATGKVIRAAAASLAMGTHRLADLAGVGERTVVRLLDDSIGERRTAERLRDALQREQVIFLDAAGPRGQGFRLPVSLLRRSETGF